MDSDKSKPWPDWRAFLWEIVTIVIGVLLALGAGQVVEAFHWRDEVAEESASSSVKLTSVPSGSRMIIGATGADAGVTEGGEAAAGAAIGSGAG